VRANRARRETSALVNRTSTWTFLASRAATWNSRKVKTSDACTRAECKRRCYDEAAIRMTIRFHEMHPDAPLMERIRDKGVSIVDVFSIVDQSGQPSSLLLVPPRTTFITFGFRYLRDSTKLPHDSTKPLTS